MIEQEAAERLLDIAKSLSSLYVQVGELERMEYKGRSELLKSSFLQGDGITAAIELSRAQVVDHTVSKGQKMADIKGLIEERDMIRFAVDHGWLDYL